MSAPQVPKLLCLSVVLLWASASGQMAHSPPGLPSLKNPLGPREQPLPYSHKTHVALGLQCKDCHVNPDPGEEMTFPSTDKCMACHANVAADKPTIVKLAGFAASGSAIPWARVYRIAQSVSFSHREHLAHGATCEACHGPVGQRDALWKEKDLSMSACMNCHKQAGASNECTICHEEGL